VPRMASICDKGEKHSRDDARREGQDVSTGLQQAGRESRSRTRGAIER
jgi:hypothetical protein